MIRAIPISSLHVERRATDLVISGNEMAQILHPQELDTTVVQEGAARLGVSLDERQLDQFRHFYLGMVEWNSRMNLTSVTEWDEVQERHFMESVAVARATPDEVLKSGRFVDIGTGAGLPGIPMKIVFPGLRGALVEATGKKVRFLRWMIERLDLGELNVFRGRAEELAHDVELREQFDLVTARAVARMPVLAELTLPFCRVGGQIVVHKTFRASSEIESAAHAISTLGGQLQPPVRVDPRSTDSGRCLVVVDKVRSTPARYPRRPGIPAKRPLAAV